MHCETAFLPYIDITCILLDYLLQYVALFSGRPYFRTLRLYDSAFRCKKETNSNDTIQRLID